MSSSAVADFYGGKNVFITGGTGFLGIALIEKILRSTPKVGNVYLLLRPKKGKTIEQRLEDLITNEIFEVLLQSAPKEIFRKLIPIQGDVSEENLGLSPDDRDTLIANVNVVIHSAATLDFNETLRSTVITNLLGTRRVMELCQQIRNLAAMVHVSSAYVNSFQLECEEVLYPLKVEVKKVTDLVNGLSDDALLDVQKNLLGDHPNTYTFTKHFAEHEVAKYADKFPCGIVRPSMITAAWKQPVPGWTISKNGPQGFLMGASKGVVRRLPVATKLIYDYIPIDVVVNHLLVTAWHVNQKRSPSVSVFHCTSSTCNPFRWDDIQSKVNGFLHKYPLKSAVWYPHLKFISSLFLFRLSAIFVHFLPAYILDTVTRLAGGRPILVRLHTNVSNSLGTLKRFIFSEWKFHNRNTMALSKTLSAADREIFNIDITALVWLDYFEKLAQGVRRYLNKESPKTLAAARKKDTILLVLHILLKLIVYSGIWWASAKLLGMTMTQCGLIVPVFYILFSFL